MWSTPVVKTVASRGEGIEELADELSKHHTWMAEHDLLKERRIARAAAEIEALVLRSIRLQLSGAQGPRLRQAAEQVVSGELDPFSAAALLS
jgi:LAO/AO transport system kinase